MILSGNYDAENFFPLSKFRVRKIGILLFQLQGTLSSVGSPLLVFIVYSVAIGAQYGALSVEYRLEEHSSLNAVADLVITVNQATIISIIVASSLLHLLIVMTCALRLDPDILVVPLAGAAGHFTYLFFFVSIHEANSKGKLASKKVIRTVSVRESFKLIIAIIVLEHSRWSFYFTFNFYYRYFYTS